jgi:hypothetical protein
MLRQTTQRDIAQYSWLKRAAATAKKIHPTGDLTSAKLISATTVVMIAEMITVMTDATTDEMITAMTGDTTAAMTAGSGTGNTESDCGC